MKLSENPIFMLIITVLFGPLGVHHFISGKIGMGLLYLITGGLFGIGWIIDVIHWVAELVRKYFSEDEEVRVGHRCPRCGRETSDISGGLCESCKIQIKQDYLNVSEHFAHTIDEVEGTLPHFEDYLSRFDALLNDLESMWDLSRDLEVTPPFRKAELQKAMDKKFTEAVNNRISIAMEKAQLTMDQDRLKKELTQLTEELIDCKYRHPGYADLIIPVIDKTKQVINTL